jgi:hypothetical protein
LFRLGGSEEDTIYYQHRRYSQTTSESDDSYTLHNVDVAHFLYPHTLLQQFENLSPRSSSVCDDGCNGTAFSLNQYIQILQSKIEEQNDVIAAQDLAIIEQSESIKALKRSLDNLTDTR